MTCSIASSKYVNDAAAGIASVHQLAADFFGNKNNKN